TIHRPLSTVDEVLPRQNSPMSNPISPEGYARLKAEWERLWHDERPKLLQEIAAAAAQGDRSENAEYIYGRKKLREIDRRLRELDALISRSTVIEGRRRDDKIYLGARVPPARADGRTPTVDLVGDDEIDPVAGDRKSTRLNSSHVKISY